MYMKSKHVVHNTFRDGHAIEIRFTFKYTTRKYMARLYMIYIDGEFQIHSNVNV